METALLVAFIAVGITAVSSIVDFVQTYHIRRVQNKLESLEKVWDERGDVGEQFGDYLMEAADPEKPLSPENPTNLQIMAVQVGQVIAQSFSNAAKGIQSGDVRTYRSVQQKMLEGLQDPQISTLLKKLDQWGIPRELADVALNVAKNNGFLDRILKNDGHQGGNASW